MWGKVDGYEHSMGKLFKVNDNLFYVDDPQAAKNTFIGAEPQNDPLPVYEEIKDQLPRPVWDGHEDAIRCYNRT